MKRSYQDGDTLDNSEYLFKQNGMTGFLTKFNKDGTIPKDFISWIDNTIFIHKEEFSYNWKVSDFRIGKSQNWVTLIHPDGFFIDIYLSNFLTILKTSTLVDGTLQGMFKWEKHKLIKNE